MGYGGEGFCIDCRDPGGMDIDFLGDSGVFGDDAGYSGEFPDGGGAKGVCGGGERGPVVPAEFYPGYFGRCEQQSAKQDGGWSEGV